MARALYRQLRAAPLTVSIGGNGRRDANSTIGKSSNCSCSWSWGLLRLRLECTLVGGLRAKKSVSGPNPEGTSVGTYVDTSGITHGFILTSEGIYTSFDAPGSTATTPNLIDPQGVIVGGYLDQSNVSHGFILRSGNFTTVDFPGAAGTDLSGISPNG